MRTILVVVTRQIGDVLLATPLIREAKTLWPEAQVDVIGFQGTMGMLEGNADVRERIATPARQGLAGTWSLARRLWRRYDLALVADPGDRAHLLAWIAAGTRCGVLPRESSSNWWKRRLLSHAVTSGGDLGEVHVVSERLALLAPWRGGDAVQPQVVGPADSPVPHALAAQLKPRYVVMHTPSMWPYKQWPLAQFRDLASRLAAAGHQVVLTGSAGEHDRACVDAMAGAAVAPWLVDAGVLDFRQLACLLRGAALYIGPDTSVSHMAAACGIPVLGIFGPTNPQRWAPWPGGQVVAFRRRAEVQTVGNVTLMQADLPCVPCGKAGCEDHRQSPTECLPRIAPERVAAVALRLLGRHESGSTGSPPARG